MVDRSKQLFEASKECLVGGVNSPVRAFKSVGGDPIFMKSGEGPYLISEEGDRYIDYVLSWGPLILGHAATEVVEAIQEAAQKGTSFGAPSAMELELAKLTQSFFPSCEQLRFVNSGTEATMSAIRLARGVTGRDIIVKFDGCYHGHVDSLLVSAGSGALTLGSPDSAGVLSELAEKTRVLPYNDFDALETLFQKEGTHIAAIIVEPVCGNMGVVPPKEGFLERLRSLCTDSGALLIFDEVMTGFRVHLGGAQALYNVQPDLTCLGKVIGGGLPCAAYGGSTEIMSHLSPEGSVYQAGTLSGNPLAMAAGISTLTALQTTDAFNRAFQATTRLVAGLKTVLDTHGFKYTINSVGTMFSLFFTDSPVVDLMSAKQSDVTLFKSYYHKMCQKGIYLAPSAFESNFCSSVHTEDVIRETIMAFDDVISSF
ncbi:glutamate-1-semialdehyde-2,1-aminomutase [Candidatus Marinamargulisbacteria bacterium SCGC AG-439-L15]|nr:glutamate-1-semialdehyde-2,1-aminomutase [Candidatus Marinamargulisbacteria bacterium SCGC AG-439-L15]